MNNYEVSSVKYSPNSDYKDLMQHMKMPVLFKGLDVGPCVGKWTPEYLRAKGGATNVKVHVSTSNRMDFLNKNFCYKTLAFGELIKRISEIIHPEGGYFMNNKEVYYLRSLGEDARRMVADIRKQFPDIAGDIRYPSFIPDDRVFSSVFRMASNGVTLWTHYDVMDNVLIQVHGRKRAVLFPPSDVSCLYMKGDKSEVLDIDNPDLIKYPEFSKCHRYECIMEAGDVLYIPALWFHNMTYLDAGVAVNVFWKQLDDVFYDSKDPYGNKDYLPASQAMLFADKALKSLEQLPHSTYKVFYAERIRTKMTEFINKENSKV